LERRSRSQPKNSLVNFAIATQNAKSYARIAATVTYIRAFFSGEVSAFWPHFWLLGGATLGGIAVGLGIILETPERPSRKQRVAMWLVIIGIVIEPICTLVLFAFDEGVSQAQQDKIIALEKRLADRELSDAQVATIGGKLNRFPGQEWDITPYWDLKESVAIANRIYAALDLAHWKYVKPAQSSFLLGGVAGVLVYVHPDAAQETKDAANALVASLNREGIIAEERPQNDPGHRSNVIHMSVGTKP
jgi:hypothetical protein